MTYTLQHLETALPSLRNTVAEAQAERIRTLLLADADADIRVSNVELGLIARAMCVELNGATCLTFGNVVVRVRRVRRGFWCMTGFHNWYYGQFATPVWGRSERRCLDCDEKQHRTYDPLGWKSY